jgi:hypothetical protein
MVMFTIVPSLPDPMSTATIVQTVQYLVAPTATVSLRQGC